MPVGPFLRASHSVLKLAEDARREVEETANALIVNGKLIKADNINALSEFKEFMR